jgi:hypothetical protein
MKCPRFVPPSFVSNPVCKFLVALTLVLVVGVAWLTAQDAQKPYQGGGGKAEIQGKVVPFVLGPKDQNGRVYQVAPPQNAITVPRHMTKDGKQAKQLAETGQAVSTTKPLAKELSAAEASALHIAPPIIKSSNSPNSSPANSGSTTSAKPVNGISGVRNSPASFPGVGYTGFIPPDGGVAAGPFNVVSVVNSTIQVSDKNGNLLSSQTLANFFSGLPGATDGPFDPSVVYDYDLGRFWVLTAAAHDASASDPTNRSTLLVAVSNSSDVTSGGWSIFWMDATVNGNGSDGQSNACDYPHFGIDAQAIYFSCNMFSFPFFSSSSSFQYAKVRILTKSQFTGGGCCTWWDFWDLREGFLNLSKSFTVRPAIMHFAGAGDGDFWVNAEGDGNQLKVKHLTNAQNCCNGIGPTLDDADQGVGSFSSPPGANQPGTTTTIDSGDDRLLFATWEYGHLSTGQTLTCNPGDGNHACLAFTEIDVSLYPSMTNVSDFAFGVSGEDLYYPFVEQNSNADKTMVYTRSDGSSTYAGAYFRGIPNSGACTNCIDGEGTLHAGAGTYINLDSNGINRWGDYHGAGADPDLLGIWVEGEYATSSGFTWATEIGPTYNSYAPIPAFSSNPLAFGNQTVFTTSGSIDEFITNNGNATLDVGVVFLSGDPDFFISSDGCSLQAIQHGNSCVIAIQFSPQSVGAGNATLNVPFNNSFLPATASITGTGTAGATSTALSLLTNPSVFGQPTKFKAVVTSTAPGTPTGTVTFKDCFGHPFCAFFPIGTATLSGGAATLTVSFLATGNHTIVALYGGDADNSASTSSFLVQTVNKDGSVTLLTSSKNPSPVSSAVTFTAAVGAAAPGSGTPTGAVTFKDGATTLGSVALSAGKAALTVSTLSPGSHAISVTYAGDGNFNSSSAALTQAVDKTTTTSLASSVNPSVFEQPVIFTATVTPNIATGTVTFKNGAVVLGTTAVVSGKAQLTTAILAVGAHSITAAYNGSGTFLASTSPALSHTVNKTASSTTVISSHNPSVFDQSVTFTATVVAIAPGSGTPTGTVTFKNGATVLGTGTLSSGKATFSTSSLAEGAHSITAVYGGNADYNTSTSAVLTETVNKAASSTTLISSHNPSVFDQSVTFTATVAAVAPGSGTPTGTVTFKNGATVLGTGTLSSGKATFSTSSLAEGAHSITAVYGGNADYNTSTSAVLTQTVNKAASSTALTSSLNPSTLGKSVTFTITVVTVAPGSGTPTGTVTLKNGATTVGTATLVNGKAIISTSALTHGAHSLTAVYSGSADDLGSTSAILTQTVN